MAGGEDAKPATEVAKDEAWACTASWLGRAGRAEMPPEMATFTSELEIGRLATCCQAESTCWMAFATAAKKVGDVSVKTAEELDRAVDAT